MAKKKAQSELPEQNAEKTLSAPMKMLAAPMDDRVEIIGEFGELLARQLDGHFEDLYEPEKVKTMPEFPAREVARMLNVSDSHLRKLAESGQFGEFRRSRGGHRFYSQQAIRALREHLARERDVSLPRRPDGMPLEVMAFTNFKGGSGKSTHAVHAAQHFALAGYRVLAIDTDPQGSLTGYFGYSPFPDRQPKHTVHDVLRFDAEKLPIEQAVAKTYCDGLDLLPSNIWFGEWEHEAYFALGRRLGTQAVYQRLQAELKRIEDRYDVVVIDCPPALGVSTLAAVVAATTLVVTVHPQMMDISSLRDFLLMVDGLVRTLRTNDVELSYRRLRFLCTRVNMSHGPQATIVNMLRALYGRHVLQGVMGESAAVASAGLFKQTLYEAARDTNNARAQDRARDLMATVNDELVQLMRSKWGVD